MEGIEKKEAVEEYLERDVLNKKLPVEQKIFYFDLRTTPNGDYLKITEKRNEHRNTIKIPVTGLSDFQEIINQIIAHVEKK